MKILLVTLAFMAQVLTCAGQNDILPPVLPWNGKSERLIANPRNLWITPAEKSGFKTTPGYEETMAWLKKLCLSSGFLKMTTIGTSPDGRKIEMVIATLEKDNSQKGIIKSLKPTLLVQAGIHSGEIDGKDAGLMLLRDIALFGKKSLLNDVNLLFVPILNVDGHERISPFNRPNQRGPENMGWRTNAQNLNLNRDYMKLDTREIRAIVGVINNYDPDFYMDIHVTDGADYQYDITYGFVDQHGHSPAIGSWLSKVYRPWIEKGLKAMGHIPGPFLNQVSGPDFSKGNIENNLGPNFSNAYADLRKLPGLLVENHSLKAYKQRVLGTYVLIEESLKLLGKEKKSLFDSIRIERNKRAPLIPMTWKKPDINKPTSDSLNHLGVKSKIELSDISGGEVIRWLGEKEEIKIPYFKTTEAASFSKRPKAYIIPAHCFEIIERLKIHGIKIEILKEAKTIEVEMCRIRNPKFNQKPYEGHFQMAGNVIPEQKTIRFEKGSAKISTDQYLGDLTIALLDPNSPESFFQWGFFPSIFQATEYIEDYVAEPLARKMLENSDLRAKFEQKKSEDPAFGNNPNSIIEWFYRQSEYADSQYLLYPVGAIN